MCRALVFALGPDEQALLGSSFNLTETLEKGPNDSFPEGMDWQHWARNYLDAARVGRCGGYPSAMSDLNQL